MDREAIAKMPPEAQEVYYNPPDNLRQQRAETYRRKIYDPLERGDPNATKLYGGYTQCDHVIEYLGAFASITQLESLRAFGCMRLGARIADLRADGYDIRTEISKGKKQYAIYRLAEDEQ